jgi:2-oxoglutarate ferredoxin oxidoreductase subunit alpha
MVIADGMIGQIMEPVELPEFNRTGTFDEPGTAPPYALRGCKGREKRIITSLYLGGPKLQKVNDRLQSRLRQIVANEQRWETFLCGDQEADSEPEAEIIVVAFGTAARIAKTAIRRARELGIHAGLFRPITVYPFPYQALAQVATRTSPPHRNVRVQHNGGHRHSAPHRQEATGSADIQRRAMGRVRQARHADKKKLLVFELNAGQMLEDVRLAVRDDVPITFYGKTGGVVPLPEDLLEVMQQM